jgi:hypothetical protein
MFAQQAVVIDGLFFVGTMKKYLCWAGRRPG